MKLHFSVFTILGFSYVVELVLYASFRKLSYVGPKGYDILNYSSAAFQILFLISNGLLLYILSHVSS